MNISEAVMIHAGGKHLSEIAEMGTQVLQGIGPARASVWDAINVTSVRDLANYKFFKIARAIETLAECELARPEGLVMNLDNALVKEYETKTLRELLKAPLSALEGLTEEADELFREMGVKTIRDLARFRFCKRAEAIVDLADYEEVKVKKQRQVENAVKKLS